MAQFIKMKYFQNSKLSFQSRHRHHLSKIKIYFPDVLEQLDDEQGIRPQDPGRHEVANHGEDHALWIVLRHSENSTAARWVNR